MIWAHYTSRWPHNRSKNNRKRSSGRLEGGHGRLIYNYLLNCTESDFGNLISGRLKGGRLMEVIACSDTLSFLPLLKFKSLHREKKSSRRLVSKQHHCFLTGRTEQATMVMKFS